LPHLPPGKPPWNKISHPGDYPGGVLQPAESHLHHDTHLEMNIFSTPAYETALEARKRV